MEWMEFIKQYIRKPTTVGAILPSSQALANKMVEGISFKTARCIVEYGPGTGVFTQKLLECRTDETVIILIEYNEDFYKLLMQKYGHEKNVYVVNDSAENADIYLKKYNVDRADCIVSGLPFASLPKEMSGNILGKTRDILKNNGMFITFQYTLFKKRFIGQYFNNIRIERVLWNVPPAYVFRCSNK